MRLRLSLREVSKSYGDLRVLNNCSQAFGSGVTAIRSSGQGGKTTLMKICALIEPPTSGKVGFYYAGGRVLPIDLKLMRRITLVLPFGTVFNTTAWNNVSYGLKVRGVGGKDLKAIAGEMLDTVGLDEKRNRNAFSLSRGECRRLLLARALAIDPDILLLDEPTRGLDDESAAIIEKVILGLKRLNEPPTIIMSVSEADIADRLADRTLLLKRGAFAIPSAGRAGDRGAPRTGPVGADEADENGDENDPNSKYYINPTFFKEE
jgi:ABC-type multidrug transport system ATPase subunit